MTQPRQARAFPGPPLRARLPDASGFVERAGVKIHYEVFGKGEPTILILPTWSVLDGAHGRFQYADLARHYRVVTFDPRGNGRSDRPAGAAAYAAREYVADALAVLDATATERAVVIGCSQATQWLVMLAAEHPGRVIGAVASGTNLPLAPGHPLGAHVVPFREPYRSTEGWAKFNAAYWREHYEDFLRFFFGKVWTEPHSQKLIDDCVVVGLGTTPEALADTVGHHMAEAEAREAIGRVRSPMLVIHGDQDAVTPTENSVRLAQAAGARLVILEGAGHCSGNRDPVKFNLLVREFVESIRPRTDRHRGWARAQARRRRVLFVPSGVGLRTVRRDLAIADALRARRPDLHIDWLAASPAREVLELHGESVHQASDDLVSETAQLEQASAAHELDRFAAEQRIDEALLVNFMVFNDVARDDHPDLVVADGARHVDHHLHENPELKRYAYAWLADAVGWLPAGAANERTRAAIVDANVQMLEQVERYPRVRDRALLLAELRDLPGERLGPRLPSMRRWAEQHFTPVGPLTGVDPLAGAGRSAVRAELGYEPTERVCLVTVGGTAIGELLLRRSIEAFAIARQSMPGLRMVAVAGPRLDAAALPRQPGLVTDGYVDSLPRLMAACDLAIVHGGQATTGELVAQGRPFLWFPFARDFDQRSLLARRLARYGAAEPLDLHATSAHALAAAMLDRIGRPVRYRRMPSDGAAQVAALLAPLA